MLACGLGGARAAGVPSSGGALVPAELLAAAVARPSASFDVIVVGAPGARSAGVSAGVRAGISAEPGRAAGLRRRFSLVGAVSAQLTGRQIRWLARRAGILAITRDAPVASAVDAAPSNVGAPSIAGAPQPGAALAADAGAWSASPPPDYAYQWQRCDAAGCVDIAGATSSAYVVAAEDVGAALQVAVTATNAVGSATTVSAPTGVVPASTSTAAPPLPTTSPVVNGAAEQGATLTVDAGVWSGDGSVAFAYQWRRCDAQGAACADVAGATEAAYVAGPDDVGATLRVLVTATDAAGSSVALTEPTAVVLAPAPATPPENAAPPSVSGIARVGETLTASDGTWSGAAPPFAYQWQRCDETGSSCADIGGATATTYVPGAGDAGSTLRVAVTATNGGGAATAVSAPTDRVAPSAIWNWQVWPYAAQLDALWPQVAQAPQPPPAIAIVDSGVDPTLPGLDGAVVDATTLTSLAQAPVADGYGHGSFVAEVAAGRGAGDAGAAPSAPIVSVDVMDDDGMAMTSDVIAAADWIAAHKVQDGIGVANFSLAGNVASSITVDPLDQALERLWLGGVVVVTAAGNYGVDGAETTFAYAPGNDPFLISVGAVDTGGTPDPSDDFAAPWSAYGHTLDGFAKPELGAPGRYVEAHVPTDSTLYVTHPDRVVAPGVMQLSGTSFAAPVVAGAAADLLALHPDWTPDEVKGALMLSAVPAGAAAPYSLGVGELDASAAAAVVSPPNPNEALEAFVVPDPAGGPTPVFDAQSWQTTAEADPTWGAASWGTASWGTASWGTASWGTAYWSSASWGTASWGTVAEATDNAGGDALLPGGYRMRWR